MLVKSSGYIQIRSGIESEKEGIRSLGRLGDSYPILK